jgi:FKBP12-rapamycin complex-associated protein
LEWLQASGDKNESRRYAAVLVLCELAKNAPTLIFGYVPQILDIIWLPLCDSKVTIRDGAAAALNACLNLAQARESNVRRQWFRKVFEEIQKGLKLTSQEAIHGSLLALGELFNSSSKFPEGRFNEIGEIVFRYKEHRDPLIRKTVMAMIPDLAKYDPQLFIDNYFETAMQYLLGQLKKDRERASAFNSIGKVSLAVGSSISPYLDSILGSVKECLVLKGKQRSVQTESPAYECVSMLAVAVGPTLTKYMHELLDYMFAGGLTESLVQALVNLSSNIPPLLPTIQGFYWLI